MRLNQTEKYEIILLVEQSELGVGRTLKELGLHKSTFYNWYNAYLEQGYDGLADKPCKRNQYWNRITDEERQLVVETALEHPQKSSREVACLMTDTNKRYISESSVYRILKAQGLITGPAYVLTHADDEFKDKTVRVNEMWQTDFTYFKIIGWGWYYHSTILDDYSRFIITSKLRKSMKDVDAEICVDDALKVTGLSRNQRPKLLTDNGSCYISEKFNKFLDDQNIKHIRGKPMHPQTQGKIERYHRSMKNVVKLDIYFTPEELERAIAKFVHYYNYERYHESLNNVTPADVYFGRAPKILERRKKIKQKTLNERRSNYFKSKSSTFELKKLSSQD